MNNLDRNSPLWKIDRNVFKETNKPKSEIFELIGYRVSSQNRRVPNLLKIRKQPQIIAAGPIIHEHGDIFTVLTQYISVRVNKATTSKEWEEILKKYSLSIKRRDGSTRGFLLEFTHKKAEKVIEIAEKLSLLDEIDSVSNFCVPSGIKYGEVDFWLGS